MRPVITVCLLGASLALAGCLGYPKKDYPRLDCKSWSASKNSHIGVVTYGWDQSGKLAFAVFQWDNRPAPEGVRNLVTMSSERSWLDKPDGTRVWLPTDVQLYECVNGQFRENSNRVTKEELEAFLNSDPPEYTVDELLAFTARRPK